MSRAAIILRSAEDRDRAIDWVRRYPPRSRVEFKKPVRSNKQNRTMWGCLEDISQQVRWNGRKLTDKQWKKIFMAALNGESKTDLVPSIDGQGVVDIDLGESTSGLEVEEMSDLIEIIRAFGAQHDVIFFDAPVDPRT